MNAKNDMRSGAVHKMALSALMTAALCILAPLSIPIGPVPITLSVLVICLFPYFIGARLSALAVMLYLLIGAVGLPVFSGFEGGVSKLVGPTGGYLIGYIPLVLIGGAIIEKTDKRCVHLAGLALGLIACYALGTVWLSVYLRIGIASALSKAVLPFIPFDAAKLVIAVIIGPIAANKLPGAGA